MKRILLIALLLISSIAWGAGVTVVTPTTSTTNASSYASAAFTPAASDLLVVFVVASGTIWDAPTMTDGQSLGWNLVGFSRKGTTADSQYLFVARSLAAASSMTVTFDCTGDAATGAAIFPLRIDSMSRTGLNAIRQTATQNNQAAAGTPAPAFSVAALTGNVVLGFVGNASSPAGLTEPSGWTEGSDVGYATPTTGGETAYKTSGFTGTTVTWGSTSATAFGDIVAELDTSASTGLLVDNTSHVDAIQTGTTLTWTHVTASSGCTNQALFVFMGVIDNTTNRDTLTGITYNGVAMKYLGRIQDNGGSELLTSAWVVVAPTTGSNSIVASFSPDLSVSSSVATGGAIGFCGVHQTYPYEFPNTNSSGLTSGTSMTVTPGEVSTSNGDYVLGAGFSHSARTLPDGSQFFVDNTDGMHFGGTQGFGVSTRPAAIGTSLTWTQSSSDVWSAMALAVRPATASPTIPVLDQGERHGVAAAAASATISSFNATGCTNGLLLYSASYKLTGGGATNISSISWNSQSLTLKDSQRITGSDLGTDVWAVETWYLKAPAAATSNLVATFSGTLTNFVHGAIVLCLADQSSTFGTVAKASDITGALFAATVDVTSQTAAVVQTVLAVKGDAQPNVNQTGNMLWTQASGTPGIGGLSQTKVGAATVTTNWTWGAGAGASSWNVMGVGINFSASTGAPTNQFPRAQ